MRAEGTVEIAAPAGAAWDAITDPAVMVGCVPGADGASVESLGPSEFRVRTRIGQGLTSFGVEARGELSDLSRPERATCTIRASMAGNNVEAVIRVGLSDQAGGTRADWEADVSIRGPLAGMAAPYIEREAPNLIDRTIGCLRERLEAGEGGEGGGAADRGGDDAGGPAADT